MTVNSTLQLKSGVPSTRPQLLAAISGATIVRLTRYSLLPPEESAARGAIGNADVFCFTAGPLLITFHNGVILGAASDEGAVSVVLWLERDEMGQIREGSILTDNEMFAVDACDPIYSDKDACSLIGQIVQSVHIFQCKPRNAKMAHLPREAAVRIMFDSQNELLLAHGLFERATDEFAVVTRSRIPKDFFLGMNEVA